MISHPPRRRTWHRRIRARITHGLARLVLAAFIFTFITARILVIFIMSGILPPQLFFHVKGTHVHHLNYGIFILTRGGATCFRPARAASGCRWRR